MRIRDAIIFREVNGCGSPFRAIRYALYDLRQNIRPAKEPWLPFCSERCRQLDLGRWLNEDYGMAVEPGEGDQGPRMDDNDRSEE